jgi:hypothetical protein
VAASHPVLLLNQTTMMLGHEIFDREKSKRALVDHAFIVSGGEITKAARKNPHIKNQKYDVSRRSQL